MEGWDGRWFIPSDGMWWAFESPARSGFLKILSAGLRACRHALSVCPLFFAARSRASRVFQRWIPSPCH
jgi:hypothetical protein